MTNSSTALWESPQFHFRTVVENSPRKITPRDLMWFLQIQSDLGLIFLSGRKLFLFSCNVDVELFLDMHSKPCCSLLTALINPTLGVPHPTVNAWSCLSVLCDSPEVVDLLFEYFSVDSGEITVLYPMQRHTQMHTHTPTHTWFTEDRLVESQVKIPEIKTAQRRNEQLLECVFHIPASFPLQWAAFSIWSDCSCNTVAQEFKISAGVRL